MSRARPAAAPSLSLTPRSWLAPTSSSLADALLAMAEAFLAGKVAAADDPEVYQVVVHVGADALNAGADAAAATAKAAGVSAETPPVLGHPADPARCHVEDGPAISVSTAQMRTPNCSGPANGWWNHPTGSGPSTSTWPPVRRRQ